MKTVEQAVRLLNEALEADPEAIRKLVDFHVDCNIKLAGHPSIQVRTVNKSDSVGLLGIINGIFGTVGGGPFDGFGHIVAVFENDLLVGFKLISEFSDCEKQKISKGTGDEAVTNA